MIFKQISSKQLFLFMCFTTILIKAQQILPKKIQTTSAIINFVEKKSNLISRINTCVQTICNLCETKEGYESIVELIKEQPAQVLPLLREEINKKNLDFAQKKYAKKLLNIISDTEQAICLNNAWTDITTMQPYMLYPLKKFKYGSHLFKFRINQFAQAKTILDQILKLRIYYDIRDIKMYNKTKMADELNDTKQAMKKIKIQKIENPTQTESHLMKHFLSIVELKHALDWYQRKWIYKDYIKCPKIKNLADRYMKKEKALSKNYYTFVHSQQWYYNFVQRLFTQLWEIRNNTKLNDFFFIHAREISTNAKSLLQETEKRKKGLKKFDCYHQGTLYLFMNYSFFGNYDHTGCSSAYYVAKNYSESPKQINIESLFEMHGYQTIYKQFEKELEELRIQHARLSTYGQSLLIAIPKSTINSHVILAGQGKIAQFTSGKSSGKLSTIMKALTTDPNQIENDNDLEFCMVMTYDKNGGMNPTSGIKIFDFNTVEEEQWNMYLAKERALMKKIAESIKKIL